MADTRELSHQDLEDIVVSMRKQSEDDDRVFVFDEHIAPMAEESDEDDRVLMIDEHIAPMHTANCGVHGLLPFDTRGLCSLAWEFLRNGAIIIFHVHVEC